MVQHYPLQALQQVGRGSRTFGGPRLDGHPRLGKAALTIIWFSGKNQADSRVFTSSKQNWRQAIIGPASASPMAAAGPDLQAEQAARTVSWSRHLSADYRRFQKGTSQQAGQRS